LKLDLFILITLVYFAELLTDFSYTNFTVSYTDALDRLRVHLNIISLVNGWDRPVWQEMVLKTVTGKMTYGKICAK